MELPPPSIRGYLKEMGIQLDIMDTVGPTTLPAVPALNDVLISEKCLFDL